jgi:heat shock protein HslJ
MHFGFKIIGIAMMLSVCSCCHKPMQKNHHITGHQKDSQKISLFDQNWKLIALKSTPVLTNPGDKNPHMILKNRSDAVTGNGGCNSFSGVYTLNGTSLRFGNFIATKMACENLNLEHSFFNALKQSARYQIYGDTLMLSDSLGENLAQFITIP